MRFSFEEKEIFFEEKAIVIRGKSDFHSRKKRFSFEEKATFIRRKSDFHSRKERFSFEEKLFLFEEVGVCMS